MSASSLKPGANVKPGTNVKPGEKPAEPSKPSKPVVALAGGVGAARFLRGLVQIVPPDELVAIVNTGDDRSFYGVHVSPDLDIVTYTLAGAVDLEKGYGLAGDTMTLVDRLGELGHENWFRLGDRDYANCLHRTLALAQGATLSETADELRNSYRVAMRILPMSDDPCPTLVELSGGRKIHFEEYMVRDGAPSDVESVDLSAASAARPAPGVLASLNDARAIVLCPSNPVVSIGPILAIPGVRDAIRESKAPVVGVSPIVGGAPVKGPAAQLLRGVGCEVSARGVAALYAQLLDGFVIDQQDAEQVDEIRALGLACRAVDSMMVTPEVARSLAEATLSLAGPAT
jgi:LPPG:FO 2-phospho-L-lactate transferase